MIYHRPWDIMGIYNWENPSDVTLDAGWLSTSQYPRISNLSPAPKSFPKKGMFPVEVAICNTVIFHIL